MPPGQIRTRWVHVSFPGNLWRENLDGSVQAHSEGREGNLPIETQIRSLRMLGPLYGAPDAPIAGHSLCRFVPRSGQL
jgi:hypothetical protein